MLGCSHLVFTCIGIFFKKKKLFIEKRVDGNPATIGKSVRAAIMHLSTDSVSIVLSLISSRLDKILPVFRLSTLFGNHLVWGIIGLLEKVKY